MWMLKAFKTHSAVYFNKLHKTIRAEFFGSHNQSCGSICIQDVSHLLLT